MNDLNGFAISRTGDEKFVDFCTYYCVKIFWGKSSECGRALWIRSALSAFLVVAVAGCGVANLGMSRQKHKVKVQDVTYFTIHYQVDGWEKKIEVDDKMLRPTWWEVAEHAKFAKGKTIYERAQAITKARVGKKQKEIVRKYFPEIWAIVVRMDGETYIKKCDGVVNFDPGKGDNKYEKFWITDRVVGRKLDVERLCRDIANALISGTHADIEAVVKDINSAPEKAVLDKIIKRSGYTTSFLGDTARECNITLAMEAFDGLVVPSGEKVSFNNIVGRRTRDRGYKEAKIIVDGEFVPGVGGGVCQASTTVFNAVLLSGLKIVESHNHSVPITYVPLGRDAMVSSAADLVFKNTTDAPLYIEAKVVDKGKKSEAIVTIYGAHKRMRYEPRVIVETLPLEVEVVGKDLVTGEGQYREVVLESGRNGRKAVTFLDTYKDDVRVNTILVRKSRYKGKPRVVMYEKVETVEVYAVGQGEYSDV